MGAKKTDAEALETAPATVLADGPAEGPGALSSAAGKDAAGPKPDAVATYTEEQVEAAIHRGVEAWRARHCYSTPISRATEALNYLNTKALSDLGPMILKEIN